MREITWFFTFIVVWVYWDEIHDQSKRHDTEVETSDTEETFPQSDSVR